MSNVTSMYMRHEKINGNYFHVKDKVKEGPTDNFEILILKYRLFTCEDEKLTPK